MNKTIEEKAKAYDELIVKAKLMIQERGNEPDGASVLSDLFPELAESEDEKIRKDSIKYLDWEYHHLSNDIDRMKIEKCIAWLEKQGEQKPYGQREECSDCEFRCGDKCIGSCAMKRGEQKPVDTAKQEMSDEEYCSLCMDINCDGCPYVDKSKHKEQKPVEWRPSKEVMDVLYSLCYVSDIIDEHKDTVLTKLYQELKREYFNSASYENMFPKEEKIKQSLTKWNEEDDKKLSSIIDLTNYAQDTWSKKYMIEVRDWLKSLKDRVQPQSKQKWGEEDEEKVKAMCEEGNLKPSERAWLKSLKDRVSCEADCTTKQEWSEEDELRIENLIAIIEGRGYPGEVIWLKNLKNRVQPQPKQEWSE